MSTAVAEQQTEQKVVTFMSWSPNLIVTRIPEDYILDARGRQIGKINRAAELKRLEDENRDRELNGLEPKPTEHIASPWKIEFGTTDPSNTFKTDDLVLIEYLREHPLFQTPYGFWELGAAPDEPKPTLTEQNVRLAKATAIGDLADIEELLKLEEETHNRTPIIEAAGAALSGLRELAGQAAPAGDENQTEEPPSTSAP